MLGAGLPEGGGHERCLEGVRLHGGEGAAEHREHAARPGDEAFKGAGGGPQRRAGRQVHQEPPPGPSGLL